ncbi:MAG: LysR substrate-binding domain-containing protein [Balneolaceae bacterium]
MTLTQLSYIVAVDTHRHFATAAEKIYVTQPTLSMQIQKLEEQLGVTIFDRSKSPVVPTAVGKEIISQARTVLKEAKTIEDLAGQADDSLRGPFRIGILPTIAPYLVPLFLRRFVQTWPEAQLIIEEMQTEELVDALVTDRLDAGIIATPVDQGHIFTEDLYVEPMVAYLSSNHSLAGKKRLEIEDLETQNIWLLNEGHCFRDQAVRLCKQTNRKKGSSIHFESGNLETLKRLVEQDFGMTLLPVLAADMDKYGSRGAHIKPFSGPVPSRKVRLVWSRKHLNRKWIQALHEGIMSSIPPELTQTEERIILE